jgi:hypothetical protein
MIERWFTREYVIAVIAMMIFFQLAGYFGLSLTVTLVIVVLSVPVQAVIHVIYNRIVYRWYRRVHTYTTRMRRSKEDAETVLAELRTKYDAGARDFPTLAALATTYSHLGRGAEAEPIAREANVLIERRGICQGKTRSARLMCDTALLLLRDSWSAQGRFSESAQLLRQRIPDSVTPNWLTAIVAYDFFLAEDTYNASVALSHLEPPSTDPRQLKTWIGPKFHFMIPYIRYRLFGDDPRAALYEHEDQLARWENTAALNAGTPVGERLAAMLAEIRELIGKVTV